MTFDAAPRLSARLRPPSLGLGGYLGLTDGAGAARPTFTLGFLTGDILDPRVTFTRASAGTRVNAAGLIESVAIDVPRFDYHPVSHAPKGLLVEDARTNIALYAQDLRTTAEAGGARPWSIAGGTNSVAANAGIGPDGAMTASKITLAGVDYSGRAQSLTLAAATAYTVSFYIKRLSGSGNGRVEIAGASVIAGNMSFTATSEWQRITLTATSTGAGTAAISIYPEYDVARTGEYLIWGVQAETGAFATSYIPTVASAVTRSADKPVMAGASFVTPFNPIEGTFLVEVQSSNFNVGGNKAIFATNDNVGSLNFMQSYVVADLRAFVQIRALGVDTAQFSVSAHFNSAASRVVLAYAENNVGQSVNGSVVGTDTAVSIPSSQVRLALGWAEHYGGLSINGCMRSLTYFNRRLPDEYLRRITL